MRRSILAAAAAAFLLSAPAVAEDVLKTAVDGTFAPHAMPKLSGGIEGFNVDLADALARQLNKKITVDPRNSLVCCRPCRRALMIS